ncbi:hypothetical protein [Muricoccus radiodurans]|uniref:hypothetical protein n=1 Tax=Muricoccus radiodurans TaxID=2231721 RepID=UPI003CF57F60
MELFSGVMAWLGSIPWQSILTTAITWAVIIGVALVVIILLKRFVERSLRNASVAAVRGEHTGFEDRLDGRTTTLLFDPIGEMVGIASIRIRKVLPFSVIRKWRVEPVYAGGNGKHTDWNFIIETGDWREPIWTIPLHCGPTNTLPNLWMAKFSAHLNG